MNLTVREAVEADYRGVCAVMSEGAAFHAAVLPQIVRVPEGNYPTPESYHEILRNEQHTLLVAESEGKIVGVLHGQIKQAPEHPAVMPRRHLYISRVVVSEEHRSQGIGRALIAAAHEWGRRMSVDMVELDVWEFNEGARRLYEQLGYKTAARRMWKPLD